MGPNLHFQSLHLSLGADHSFFITGPGVQDGVIQMSIYHGKLASIVQDIVQFWFEAGVSKLVRLKLFGGEMELAIVAGA